MVKCAHTARTDPPKLSEYNSLLEVQRAVIFSFPAGETYPARHIMPNTERTSLRVESRLPRPEQSSVDDAVTFILKILHTLPATKADVTTKSTHLIESAVKEGHQRNAAEWAVVQMEDYEWITLAIPVWGGVIQTESKVRRQRSKLVTTPRTKGSKLSQRQWYFGDQDFQVVTTEKFWNPRFCCWCNRVLNGYDYDRSTCHDCRSNQGKLIDLCVAIHAEENTGQSPEELIKEWNTIRALLRVEFGFDKSNIQLWECLRDRMEAGLGWDNQKIFQTNYGELIEWLRTENALRTCTENRTTAEILLAHENKDAPTEQNVTQVYPLRAGYVGHAPPKVIESVRKVIADWDGSNWNAVRHTIELTRLETESKPLDDWTLDDVRQRFGIQQKIITLKLGDSVQTPNCNESPPQTNAVAEGKTNPSEAKETMSMLLAAYTRNLSNDRLQSMAAILNDATKNADEKIWALNEQLSLDGLSGSMIGKLVGCTKQMVFKSRYWINNRKGKNAETVENRRERLRKNGRTFTINPSDEELD